MDNGIKRELYSKYTLGDMQARYIRSETGNIELLIIPEAKEKDLCELKQTRGDSLIQAKLIGDKYPGAVGNGNTMRNSETVENLKLVKQEVEEGEQVIIKTVMTDGKAHTYIHYLAYTPGDYALESYTEFINESDEDANLEMLSSFSLSELTPFEEGEAANTMKLHRIRSKWSHEGRLVSESAEDLQLEVTWVGWHPNSVRYGSIGSMPVRTYSPFGLVEDIKAGVIWGAQLMIESSWQMEFYRRDEALAFSGGIADREFGAWIKKIAPGESFITPHAIITVCEPVQNKTELVDYASQRMTRFINKYVVQGPESEKSLPVMFNEYCTTWGLPSYENIDGILKAIKGHGLEYFVIDCGWFVEEGKSWGDGMGDYIPSDILFPNGLGAMTDRIREEGLVPGIWFEIDNVGRDAHIYEKAEWMLKRDGITLETGNRRFFDMRNPEVIGYLDEKVIGQLNKYGFGYIKMDYNDTIGLGVDGSDSLGEGLRLDREASVDFVRRIKEKVPGIVIENCASGGHKLEPLMMSVCAMASFSDAHECEHIPSVAGLLHRTVLPRQSQIWAAIRKEASLQRIAWLLTGTLLGRMCFSGDVTELSDEQWKAIDEGIAFYKLVAPVIANGYTHIYDNKGASDRELTGWQAFIREETGVDSMDTGKGNNALVTVFVYGECSDEIRIKLPAGLPTNISQTYCTTDIKADITGDELVIRPENGRLESIALYLQK